MTGGRYGSLHPPTDDHHYVLAAAGLLTTHDPVAAQRLLTSQVPGLAMYRAAPEDAPFLSALELQQL